uniref:Uncharacterized protein n=1 Tax=Rhizophora mucronata TaxID=61149 RepID=A0A2P2P4B2_RHIMU
MHIQEEDSRKENQQLAIKNLQKHSYLFTQRPTKIMHEHIASNFAEYD